MRVISYSEARRAERDEINLPDLYLGRIWPIKRLIGIQGPKQGYSIIRSQFCTSCQTDMMSTVYI
jgi:hypothetical protein